MKKILFLKKQKFLKRTIFSVPKKQLTKSMAAKAAKIKQPKIPKNKMSLSGNPILKPIKSLLNQEWRVLKRS
ncbi:hypothetical protein D3C87_1559240 [compost metagenome]